ncbi:hypothetical protein JCM21900_005866, partial [Sporobolomyces salmonicolor]
LLLLLLLLLLLHQRDGLRRCSSLPFPPFLLTLTLPANPTLLRPFIERILAAPDVTNAVWERGAEIHGKRAHEWASEIKKRIVDLEPRGYKYLVTVSSVPSPSPCPRLAPSVPPSLSQTNAPPPPPGRCTSVSERGSSSASSGSGRAVLATFWDPSSDVAVSEVFQNDTVVVAVLAVAIRILY